MRYTVEKKMAGGGASFAAICICPSRWSMRPIGSSFHIYLPVSADDFARINKGDVIEVLVTVVHKEGQ